MKLSIRAAIFSILVVAMTISGSIVQANEKSNFSNGRTTVIAVDLASISDTNNAYLFESFTGILSTLQPGENFYFSTMDEPGQFLGPFEAGSMNFTNYKSLLEEKIADYIPGNALNLPEVVSQAYNLMGTQSAQAGSTLYIFGNREVPSDLEYTAKRLDPLADMFASSEWVITGITPANADPSMVSILERIAVKTGSIRYELTIDAALRPIANTIMTRDSLGSLTLSGQASLLNDEVLTSTIEIAPGTKETTVILFKEDPFGSLKLNSPAGQELAASDKVSFSTVETPHTVIWKITNPTAGTWTVDAQEMKGEVSSWHVSSNKFRLNLGNNQIIPTGQPLNLIAYVTEKAVMVSPGSDSLIRATVTGPDGNSVLYELNDTGEYGDAVADDYYYSATIADPKSEGDYNIGLELSWAESPNTVIEQLNLRAQTFPQMEVTQLNTERMYLDRRSNIATIFVNVAGQSFAVDPSSIKASFGEGADSGQLDIIPREGTSDGRAWMYDVVFTPYKEGITTLALNLNIEYAGQVHQQVSESLALTAINLPSPAPEAYTPVVLEVIPESQPITMADAGIAVGLIALPIALISLIAAGFIYQRSQPRPFGLINNEDGSVLVDFGNLERSKLRNLLFPSTVKGKETKIPELEGITFKFRKDKVDIETFRVSPTVRVNNKPIVGEITLMDSSWIGSHGRLFTFINGKNGISVEHGFGDD